MALLDTLVMPGVIRLISMRALVVVVVTAVLWSSTAGAQSAISSGASDSDRGGEQQPVTVTQRQLAIGNRPWLGDFDKLPQRRLIRVYAPFSRSLYVTHKGRERGLAVELVRDFERYLNAKHAKALGKRPVTIYVLPATRDKLLPDLEAGFADIGVGNLTITEERLKLADFVPGDDGRRTISEIVVTGPASPKLAAEIADFFRKLGDQAGRRRVPNERVHHERPWPCSRSTARATTSIR